MSDLITHDTPSGDTVLAEWMILLAATREQLAAFDVFGVARRWVRRLRITPDAR